MSEITREEYSKRFNEEAKKFRARKLNAALSDEEMANAKGGVGGANEATCPQCGKTMRKNDNPYGDSFWTCDACGVNQMLSDADTIEFIRAIESEYGSSYIKEYLGGYPVWWGKLKGLK